MSLIKTWSYSRLAIFEQCKHRAKLAFIDRIPEPPRPLPPGKTEHANDRGTRIHLAAEMYAGGKGQLTVELEPFREEFQELRAQFKSGRATLEGDWAYDTDWVPTAWMSDNAWLRVKCDAMVKLGDDEALVIDYKTGRKFGNEIKHAEQGQLYQLATLMKYPDLEKVTVEFWYLDQDDITKTTYTRSQGMQFYKKFDARGKDITSEVDFPPNPNKFTCRYCPYGPKGTGHCTVGIQ
jgi:hypothetical protein